MDTITITLTPSLRAEMADALNAAIHDGVHGDHVSYLRTLAETPTGTVIDGDHALADVLTFFGIYDF